MKQFKYLGFNDMGKTTASTKEQCTIPVVRHSCEMITEEYVYKNDFRFQRTQKHGIWFVTYRNHLITFGQYRHDLEQWINSNYA